MKLLNLYATANGRNVHSAPLSFLVFVSAYFLVLGGVCCFCFDRQQIAHSAWISLAKFGASLSTYALTMQWMMPYMRRNSGAVHSAAYCATLGATMVLLLLFVHALLLSVFPFLYREFSIFAILAKVAILPPTLFIVVAFKSILTDVNAPTALRRGLLWATGLALLGCIPAILILVPNLAYASAVPVASGRHVYEALKLSHFTGLHSLQIMPIFCWLVSMKGAPLNRQLQVIDWAGATLLSLMVLFSIKGIFNEAIVAPGILTSMILALITLSLCKLIMVFYGPPLPRKT